MNIKHCTIWNELPGAWVATSELASTRGKRSVSVKLAAVAVAVASVVGGAAMAQDSKGDVALGANAITAPAIGTSSVIINGTTYAFAGTAPLNTVSVGAVGAERTITNVAAGRISDASTDAVNGSQLNATNKALTTVAVKADNSLQYDNPAHSSSTLGGTGSPVVLKNVAAGVAGTDAANVNQVNTVANKWSTGNPTNYTAPVATGTDATAVGSGAKASGTNSVALGNNSNDGGRTKVLSVGSVGGERQITNVAAGTQGTDAVNMNQLNGLQNSVNDVQRQLNSNERILSGGIAASAALAIVTAVEPGRYHMSGALAGYNGAAGIGFNVVKRSDNGQVTFHSGVGWATGGSKAIVRVGVGYSFD